MDGILESGWSTDFHACFSATGSSHVVVTLPENLCYPAINTLANMPNAVVDDVKVQPYEGRSVAQVHVYVLPPQRTVLPTQCPLHPILRPLPGGREGGGWQICGGKSPRREVVRSSAGAGAGAIYPPILASFA